MSDNQNHIQPEQKEAPVLRKKIGRTTYNVAIHFSQTSMKNMNDKLFRLMKNDIGSGNY